MNSLTLLLVAVCAAVVSAKSWSKEMENPDLHEGDIVLDPDERPQKGVNSYASIKGGRWPGGVVPYVITSSSTQDEGVIMSAISAYNRERCLNLIPRTNQRTYISFHKSKGCSSPVGYRSGRINHISIGTGCSLKGIVMHEIGHSIGLYHEQSRPDRDGFVTILTDNIKPESAYNFNKHSRNTINSLGTRYDYGSMMHYGAYAFSRNRKPTIRTKNGAEIGQRNGFSTIDKQQIKLMYGCS